MVSGQTSKAFSFFRQFLLMQEQDCCRRYFTVVSAETGADYFHLLPHQN
jgi:hypothetical protein